MPDAQGSFKGISLSGVKNAWLDNLRRVKEWDSDEEHHRVYAKFEARSRKMREFLEQGPDPGCSYPSGERCGRRCWDTERCAFIWHGTIHGYPWQ